MTADCAAEDRRRRPQVRKIDADQILKFRVIADVFRSKTPRQRVRAFAFGGQRPSVEAMVKSPDAHGRTVSHEAIYRWIYAMPKGELAREGIILQSKRTTRKRRKPLGERAGSRIVGMVSIDARPETALDRRVPGSWEGDLVVGKAGKSAVATLVERSSRYLIMLGLPEGRQAAGLADVLSHRVHDLPALMRGSLTWDQGTEMARHAQVTVATDLPVYFAHPHSSRDASRL